MYELVAEHEVCLPLCIMIINLYSFVHLVRSLLLAGPFPFWWMFPMERENFRFRKSLCSFKNPEESILRSYVVREFSQFGNRSWRSRCSELQEPSDEDKVQAVPLYLTDQPCIELCGASTVADLLPAFVVGFHHLWVQACPAYSELYLRFLLGSALPDIDSSISRFSSCFPASRGSPQTALQQSMVEGNTRATRYLRARRNGVYFRAVERDHFKRQHSGIKAPHSFSGTMLFGQIQAFWLHPLCRHPDFHSGLCRGGVGHTVAS